MTLEGWIPFRFIWRTDGPRVQWTLLGQQRLLDPFFEQTMQRQMMHPFNHLFRIETSVEEMVYAISAEPPVELKGLIFHMSRCGSTLISQMLAASERNIVASEPSPLDGVLRAHLRNPKLSRELRIGWIRAMVAALGQPRLGGEDGFYIKLDCWHIHQVDIIREAFPDVPLIFLYRDPVEVMVSHARMPAAWTVPGMLHPMVLQLQPQDWDPAKTDVYCAKALAGICAGGLDAAQRYGGLLVNYSELPQAMYGRLFRHFSLSLEDIPDMLTQSKRDAKSPQQTFEADTESKQAEAKERLRVVTAEHLQPIYERLEAERQRQLEA